MASLHAPGAAVSTDELAELEEILEDELPAYLEDLATLVNVDCGSYTKAGVDEVGRWTARFLERLGAAVEVRPDALARRHRGRHVPRAAGRHRGSCSSATSTRSSRRGPPAPGRSGSRPGIADGPGVTDMKSGLLAGLYALLALARSAPTTTTMPSTCRSSGSCSSPTRTRRSARRARRRTSASWPSRADACFVLECARANGDIVSARKGTRRPPPHGPRPGRPRRRRAREGPQRDPRGGPSDDRAPGPERPLAGRHRQRRGRSTAGPGRTSSPRRRASRSTSGRRAGTASRRPRPPSGRSPRDHGARTRRSTVEEAGRHWPMERLERSGRLVDHAIALADRLGFPLADCATGGASDANTTSGLGRADARRPRTDRRQRSLAGRVPRGRLDRAADDAARGAPPRGRPRPARGVVAARTGHDPTARSRPAGRGRRAPATAGRS